MDKTELLELQSRLREAESNVEIALTLVDQELAELQVAPPQPTPPSSLPTTNPTTTTPRRKLHAEAKFYDYLRGTNILGPKISQGEFEGCKVLLMHGGAATFPLADMAYVLATAYHEVAGTMQPIKEYGGNAYFHRMYDIEGARPAKAKELGNLTPGDGIKYCGRGYPQVTGKSNYEKLTKALGIDLVNFPERLLEAEVAAQATVYGMMVGLFTGKKLADYLPREGPASRLQFKGARRIINGTDKDDQIAGHALVFQAALQAGQYS